MKKRRMFWSLLAIVGVGGFLLKAKADSQEVQIDLQPASRNLSVLVGFPVGEAFVTESEGRAVWGSPASGFIALGADYELRSRKGLGYGGSVRLYNTTDQIGGQDYGMSLLTLGGFFRAHFQQNDFDFYISPGLGIANGEITSQSVKSKMGLLVTPTVAVGVTVRLTEVYSVGFENMRLIVLDNKSAGTLVDDYMLKGEMNF